MNFQLFKGVLAAAALALSASAMAQSYDAVTDATTITSQSFNVLTFNGYNELNTTGPVNVGAEIGQTVVFTSVPTTRLGATNQDLGDNGLWGARDLGPTPTGDGNFVASAFIRNRGEFVFSFDNPVAAIGAYFNQFQQIGSLNNRLELTAYDQLGNVLQSFQFTINTDPDSYNEGSFLGIRSSVANIYGFGVSDGTVVLDNLTFTVPIPEPSTYALMAAGLLMLGYSVRKSRKG
jgi:PEP-CTERM motif